VQAHGAGTTVDVYAASVIHNGKAGVHAYDAAQIRLRAGSVVEENNEGKAQVVVEAWPRGAGKALIITEGRNSLGKVVQGEPGQVLAA
jgi:hypothetical protein